MRKRWQTLWPEFPRTVMLQRAQHSHQEEESVLCRLPQLREDCIFQPRSPGMNDFVDAERRVSCVRSIHEACHDNTTNGFRVRVFQLCVKHLSHLRISLPLRISQFYFLLSDIFCGQRKNMRVHEHALAAEVRQSQCSSVLRWAFWMDFSWTFIANVNNDLASYDNCL